MKITEEKFFCNGYLRILKTNLSNMKNFCNNYDDTASSIVSSFVAPSMAYTTNRKVLGGKRVLRERDFVEGLSSVIEKQFFPDLKRLKAQAAGIEYQDDDFNEDNDECASNEEDATQYTAPREGDLDNLDSARSKLFELAGLIPPSKLSSLPNKHESNFLEKEKPLKVSRISRTEKKKEEASHNSMHQVNVLTIDEYLSKHTSQDNYEYHKLQEKSIKQHREKYLWAYSDHNKTDTKKMRLLNDKKDPSFFLSDGHSKLIEDKDTSGNDNNSNNLLLEKNNVNEAIAKKIVIAKNKMKNNNTTTNVNKRKLGSIRYNATRYDQFALNQNKRKITKMQRGTQNYKNSIYGGGDDHYSLVLSSNSDMMSDQSSIRGGASSIAWSNKSSMYHNGGVPRWGTGTSSIHSSSQSRRISRMGRNAKALALKLLENDRKQKKR